MKTATLVRDLGHSAAGAHQKLFKLSEPITYGYEQRAGTTTFVVVSAVRAFMSGPETYIFPANDKGEVVDWGELDGSFRGGLDHDRALREAGFEVTP